MSELPDHPLIHAVKPVLDMLGALIIPVEDAMISDRALEWDGEIIAAVRLPRLQGALDRLIRLVETELDGPLDQLSREDKQRAEHVEHGLHRVDQRVVGQFAHSLRPVSTVT